MLNIPSLSSMVAERKRRDLDNLYPRQLVPRQLIPRTTHTQDDSYPGQFAPRTTLTHDDSYSGQLVPRTTLTQDDSYPAQIVPRTTLPKLYSGQLVSRTSPNYSQIMIILSNTFPLLVICVTAVTTINVLTLLIAFIMRQKMQVPV